MEILAGARDEVHLRALRGLPVRATTLETLPTDYEEAAVLYRICRSREYTVRKILDCLIAAHATRAGTPVLHVDADFDTLARHTPLLVDAA